MRRLAALAVMLLFVGVMGGCGGSDDAPTAPEIERRVAREPPVEHLGRPRSVTCRRLSKRDYFDCVVRVPRETSKASDILEGDSAYGVRVKASEGDPGYEFVPQK